MIKLTRTQCPKPEALDAKNYSHRDNKNSLRDASFGKCMYCESKISHVDFAHIEHIKPKAPDKYPELKYVWENLGYSCSKCNNKKSDSYHPQTPYIDPYTEYPDEHIVFIGWCLYPRNGSERGEITIQDVGLNRVELIEQRKERIEKLILAINCCYRTSNASLRSAALRGLKAECDPSQEYSYALRQVLCAHGVL